MILLSPNSTLFPYTTLFRSLVLVIFGWTSIARIARSSVMSVKNAEFVTAATALGAGRTTNLSRQDRKSTRLNSSHVAISYAVFCLKKKRRKKFYNLD